MINDESISDGGEKRPYSYKIIDFPYENPNMGTARLTNHTVLNQRSQRRLKQTRIIINCLLIPFRLFDSRVIIEQETVKATNHRKCPYDIQR